MKSPASVVRLDAVDPQVVNAQVPIILEIAILDASADTDTVLPFACRVVAAHMRATGIAAHATTDTWQLKNTANAISDAVAKTATVESISRAATLAAAYVDIPAGGILRVTASKTTNVAGKVYVTLVRTDIP